MRALWVDKALVWQYFVDPVSTLRRFTLMLGALFTLRAGTNGCRLVLLEGGSLWRDAVVRRRVVCLDFLPFLYDDVACITPNIDHTAEVAVGVVVVVTLLFL